MKTTQEKDVIFSRCYESTVLTYCDMVAAGKPVASCQIPDTMLHDMEIIAERVGCLTYTAECGSGWCLLFIYRRPFLLQIIKHSLSMTDANAVEVFFRGCMYGYELSAIEEMADNVSEDARCYLTTLVSESASM